MYVNVTSNFNFKLTEIMKIVTNDNRYNNLDVIDVTFGANSFRVIFRDRDAREQRKAKKFYMPYDYLKESIDFIKNNVKPVEHVIFKK